MRFFGYEKRKKQNKPIELEEITLRANSKELGEIANFLLECSAQIKRNKFCWDHRHFKPKKIKVGKYTPELIVSNSLY